jgi:hypothetical protein
MSEKPSWTTLAGGRKFLAFNCVWIVATTMLCVGLIGEQTWSIVIVSDLGLYSGANLGATVAHFKGMYKGKP